MKTNQTAKIRKKIARLKREMQDMERIASKHDFDEDFATAGEKLNSRYENKHNELKRLKNLSR